MTIEELLRQVSRWATSRPDVRGAVLVGSQARTQVPADEFSDVDLAIFADDPAALLADTGWLRTFGEPLLTFFEPTAVGAQFERRVLFDDGLEVDFSVFPADGLEALARDPGAAATIAKGYLILHDELGLAELFAGLSPPAPRSRELTEIGDDFWYHTIWAAKKWRRGEAIVARSCLEVHLKGLLLEADRLRVSADTWHGTRFVETWAAPRVLDAWWQATARAPEELPAALLRLCDAFSDVSPHDAARSRLMELLA